MLPSTFQFTQGNLQDFSDCRRRFYLRYIKNLPWPAATAEPHDDYEIQMQYGSVFHKMIQQYFLGIPAELLSRSTNSDQIRVWWNNFLEYGPKLDPMKDEGAQFLPEFTLSAVVRGISIVAKYDLIIINAQNKFVIYDWKTSQYKPNRTWLHKRWQTLIYQFIAVSCMEDLSKISEISLQTPPRLIYWFANFPTQPVSFEYSKQQFDKDFLTLKIQINHILSLSTKEELDFPLTNDLSKCNYCNYRSLCDRGNRAGSIYDEYIEEDIPNEVQDIEQITETEF